MWIDGWRSGLADKRNLAIVVLATLCAALGTVLIAEHWPDLASISWRDDRQPVGVLDVVLDRESLATLDILFDRPLGEGHVGEILGSEPATFEPALAGVWRWQGANVLRFEPSGRFAMATQYTVTLIPDRLVPATQVLHGNRSFPVKTDQFRVERVDAFEEPAPNQAGFVVLRADLRFNYPVKPEMLAAKVRLLDPAAGEGMPVPLAVETRETGTILGVRSEPVRKLRDERRLQLVIFRELTPADGNVALAASYRQDVPLGSVEKLAVRGVRATPGEKESTLAIELSSEVRPEGASRFLRVTPAVKYLVSADRNFLSLTGPFRPGGTYRLQILRGLTGTDTSILPETHEERVLVPDLPARVDFQSQGMFLSASGYRNLALESANVDKVNLTVERVYLNNLFFLFSLRGWYVWNDGYWGRWTVEGGPLGTRLLSKPIALPGPRNHTNVTTLRLDDVIPKDAPGLYSIALSRTDPQRGEDRGVQRWLLLTDMGIVAEQGRDEILVWISSFKNLAPVEGADVRILDAQNQTIARGRTGADGLWRARGLAEAVRKSRATMITAERRGDFSFLLMDRNAVDTTGFDVAGGVRPPRGYEAFLYGERDIYRPGETVKGVAIVRDRDLSAPPRLNLIVRHRDPAGREMGTSMVRTDERGTASFAVDVRMSERTGNHVLELLAGEDVIGSYRFHVEDFVPDRIHAELEMKSGEVGPGKPLTFDAVGTYLFGPPAEGLSVETRVRLEAAPFSAQGFESYQFEDASRSFSAQEIFQDQGQKLDAQGRHEYTVTLPAGLRPPASMQAVVTARVSETGGRGVFAQRRLSVHPYPYYLGIKKNGDLYPPLNQRVTFEYVAVAPGAGASAGAALVEARTLRAELYEDRWNTVLRMTPSGTYRYECERVARLVDTRAIPAGTSHGAFSFIPRVNGSYRAAITDPETGASAQVEFYASEWGYTAWAIKDPSRIELEADRTEYRGGETATILVRAPFAGRMLVVVGRDGIEETQIHDLAGNTAKLKIPIRADYRPNVYVSAVLVRAADRIEVGGAGRAFGALSLNVERLPGRMGVTIDAPEEIRPHTRLTVTARAEKGAAVTIAAVDEGILQLVQQKTPDPYEHFYRKLALELRAFDIFALLFPEVAPLEGKSAAGGDGAGEDASPFVRTEGIRRAEPVAFWSDVQIADDSGRVRATFDVPEFQGALRLMAVAHRQDVFGSSQRTTRVRDPLLLLPTFPRFLSLGETARIPVTVRNDTPKDGRFTVSLRVEGAVRVAGESSRTLDVPRGADRTIAFSIETGEAPGDAFFTLTGSGNGETTTATAPLSLRADLPARTLEGAGGIADRVTTLPAADLGAFRPGTVTRDLRISSLPVLQFTGRLAYVLTYPYGCVEQTTSSAFPLLYLGDLAKELEPDLFRKGDPAVYVQAGIDRLATMQVDSGGFSFWPNGDTPYPWGSVYATHFLVEARRAGYPVESAEYDRALGFVQREARAQEQYLPADLQRTVYALYVLARAGKPDIGTMDFVRERHKAELSLESRALLGAAYAAAGNPRAFEEMIRDVQDAETRDRQTGDNLNSTVRNRAFVLMALLDAKPNDPRVPSLIDRLSRDAGKDGFWWNTHETSMALVALGQFFRRQASKPPFSGKVYSGSALIGSFTSKTSHFRDLPAEGPITVRMDPGYRSGAAFFALRTRGIPSDASFRPDSDGLQIEREFLTRMGREQGLDAIAQGQLVVVRTRIRSSVGAVNNVVLSNLLPAGLEVENPRLESSESLPWITETSPEIGHLDMRDDRVLEFLDLPDTGWHTSYAVLRAVTAGTFRLPPVQAEAMYDPSIRATGARGTVRIVAAGEEPRR